MNQPLNPQEQEDVHNQLGRLEEQINLLEKLIMQSHMRDIAYHFTKKSAIIKVNLLAGLARGVGLTLGTALFLAVTFYVLSHVVSLPIVGEHITSWLDTIQHYREFQSFDLYQD